MKRTIALSLAAMAVLSLAACDTGPTSAPPGTYKTKQSTVNQYGTKTETETTTDVYYDEYGNKRATQRTETSRDPKGLFNKTETERVQTYRE